MSYLIFFAFVFLLIFFRVKIVSAMLLCLDPVSNFRRKCEDDDHDDDDS